MEKRRHLQFFLVTSIFILLILSFRHEIGRAAEGEDESVRQGQVLVSYTRYKWWLIRWVDNLILCTVYADQEGLPTGDNIFDSCGKDIYETWKETAPCTRDAKDCAGVYLHLISQEPAERTIIIEYPPPIVEVELVNCPRITGDNLCDRLPGLQISAQEPIPGEEITAVRGFYNGKPFYCPGSACEVPLTPTPIQGITIDFFVESSFGDVSETFKAFARVVDSGTSADPNRRGWYVDILSDQWAGRPAPTCAQIWDTFPPIGEPPDWLSTPAVPELLATQKPVLLPRWQVDLPGTCGCFDLPILGTASQRVCK